MQWLNVVLYLYAALVLAGGIYGYVATKSVPSIIASPCAAVLTVLGVWLAGTNRSAGYGLCAAVALALAVFFGMRVAQGGTMPGIPGLAMSLIALGCIIAGLFAARP